MSFGNSGRPSRNDDCSNVCFRNLHVVEMSVTVLDSLVLLSRSKAGDNGTNTCWYYATIYETLTSSLFWKCNQMAKNSVYSFNTLWSTLGCNHRVKNFNTPRNPLAISLIDALHKKNRLSKFKLLNASFHGRQAKCGTNVVKETMHSLKSLGRMSLYSIS